MTPPNLNEDLRNKNILNWSDFDVGCWLQQLNYPQHLHMFKENEISGEILVHLDHEALKDLGIISVGIRLNILREIYHLKLFFDISVEPEHYVPPSETINQSKSSSYSQSNLINKVSVHDDRLNALESDYRRLFKSFEATYDELMCLKSDSSSKPSKHLDDLLKSPDSELEISPKTITVSPATTSAPSSAPPNTSSTSASSNISETLKDDDNEDTRDSNNLKDTTRLLRQASLGDLSRARSGKAKSNVKVKLDDSCWTVLPAALKKYKIDDDWTKYALFICYGKTERCLSYDERPLQLFQKLKEQSQQPVFMLRHIKELRSPISIALQKQRSRREANNTLTPPSSSSNQPHSSLSSANANVTSFRNGKPLAEICSSEEIQGYAIAIYPYTADREDEFDVNVSDQFEIVQRAKGWWVVRRQAKNEVGWVPTGCLLEVSSLSNDATQMQILSNSYAATALIKYTANTHNECGLHKDDKLRVYKKHNHWCYVVKEPNGERGWTPSWFAVQSLDVLITIFRDESVDPLHRQHAILCLASAYHHILKFSAVNQGQPQGWNKLQSVKSAIFALVEQKHAPLSLRLSAIKFAQRSIVVQSRPQGRTSSRDVNVSLIAGNHPFIDTRALESENTRTLHSLLTLIFTPQKLSIVTATINILGVLARQRPQYAAAIAPALATWTPAPLQTMVTNPSQLKSVDKLLYGVLKHLVKLGLTGNSTPTVMESLSKQAQRIEQLTRDEQSRKKAMKRAMAETPSLKSLDLKRQRTNDHLPSVFADSSSRMDIDVTKLPLESVIDGLIESLEKVSKQSLENAINKSRERIKTEESSQSTTHVLPSRPQPGPSRQLEPQLQPFAQDGMDVDEKPIDPLKVDIDDDELEDDVEGINRNLNDTVAPFGEAQQAIQSQSQNQNHSENEQGATRMQGVKSKAQSLLSAMQKVQHPTNLDKRDRLLVIRNAIGRICKSIPHSALTETADEDIRKSTLKFQGRDLWSVVLVRLLTRGLSYVGNHIQDEQLQLEKRARETLIDFISMDFDRRYNIAILWLNEEWFNYTLLKDTEENASLDGYNELLSHIIDRQITQLSNNNSNITSAAFVKFVMDLPIISQDSLNKVHKICLDSESLKAPVGFIILRELVAMRLPVRQASLEILLTLAVHPDLKTRRAAVNSVRKWVPDNEKLTPIVLDHALKSLHSLYQDQQTFLSSLDVKKEEDGTRTDFGINQEADVKLDNDDQPMKQDGGASENSQKESHEEGVTLSPKERAAAIDTRILERSELVFSLCLRQTEILKDIFIVYTRLSPELKDSFEKALTPMIRGLGSSNQNLLVILKTFDQDSEPLALRILNVLTDFGKEKPSAELVKFIRELSAEREGKIDPRFVIPILQELSKDEIIAELPRIVKLLKSEENKQLIRTVFSSVVEPPQSFGSVNTNVVRVDKDKPDKITPAELLTILHERETEIGLKETIIAIAICFSLTDIFRSDVLAIFMQSMSEVKVLPKLFMRTVIQAVTTYKTLVPFVSTNLFSRLITRKIWLMPVMWEGFVRCAKVIAPASFGALLQLPQDTLKDLVKKQPTLRPGLYDFVLRKAPKSQILRIFDDIPAGQATPPPSAS
ncbi:hypothetical protein E3P91_00844 [Wallemia ichthyophaga]|nr:hypothetical protein E3P91_00844 [Wallemia ichthyophaga]